jgi:hypothetical protein
MKAGRLTVAALTATLLVAAPASAASTATFSFTSSKAKTPAGFKLSGVYDGSRIVDQISVTLPAGTLLDLKAVPKCQASDAEIEEKGPAAACPANTRLGTGKGSADLGGTPTTFDLIAVNDRTGVLVDLQLGGKTAFIVTTKVSGRKIDFSLALAPSLNAKLTGFSMSFSKLGTARKPLVRTPATCPKKKVLTALVSTRAHQGATEVVKATTRCSR